MMEFTYSPRVSFRGTRRYVHSTDLYEHLIAGASAAGLPPVGGPVTLEIRSPILTQPEFNFGSMAREGAANFALGTRDGTAVGCIMASGRRVETVVPYAEQRIWDAARVSERRINLAEATEMAPIEVVTALGVRLHRAVLPPPDGMRWLLSRLSLVRPLNDGDAIGTSVEIVRSMARRVTRSVIMSANDHIGEMEFIIAVA